MTETDLSETIIRDNSEMIKERMPALVGERLRGVVLFGSCARGDYGTDSDMDVAILIDDSRESMAQYTYLLSELSTDIAMSNFSVVNFLCIPWDDFRHKPHYDLYWNIWHEGIRLYG